MKMPKEWERVRHSQLSKDELLDELRRENSILKAQNREFELKVEHLRISRRILMDLLEKVEKEKTMSIRNLEKALDLERRTKRRLIRQNHPVRLVLVKNNNNTVTEFCKDLNINNYNDILLDEELKSIEYYLDGEI